MRLLVESAGGDPYAQVLSYFNPPFLRPPPRDGRRYEEDESASVLAGLVLRGTAGTIMEDSGVLFGQGRWLWHFYDPFLASPGLVGFARALERARDVLWPEAVNLHDYSDTARDFAYYRLGQVLHLLEDMASPAHVHNDKHPQDDFERHVEGVGWLELALRRPVLPYDASWQPRPGNLLAQFFIGSDPIVRAGELGAGGTPGLVDLTYTATTFQAALTPVTGPNVQQGELREMFPDLVYELVDSGSDYYCYWMGTVGRYFLEHDFLESSDWWEVSAERTEGNYPRNAAYSHYYIENAGDARPQVIRERLFRRYDPDNPASTPLRPNPVRADGTRATLVELWAGAHEDHLIRPASEHVAGLMRHYVDLVNPPPFVERVRVEQAPVWGGPAAVAYAAEWRDDLVGVVVAEGTGYAVVPGNQIEVLHGRVLERAPANRALNGAVAATLTVEFSEPVRSVQVLLAPHGPQLGGSLDAAGRRWTGTVPAAALATYGGSQAVISVFALDADGLPDSPAGVPNHVLDGNPATPAKLRWTGSASSESYAFMGYEPRADESYAIAVDVTAPAPVAGLSAQTGDGALTLTWTAPTDPDLAGYLLFRREEAAGGPGACAGPSRTIDGLLFCAVLDPASASPLRLPAGTTSWTDANVLAGTLYTYAVVAVDLAGNESAAAVVECATPLTVALVLDRSGSMAWPSGSGSRSRFEVARSAAGLFLDLSGARNSYRTSADQRHKAAVVSFGADVVDEAQGLRLYERPRDVTGAAEFAQVLGDIATAVEEVPAWTNVTGGLERAWLAFDTNLDGTFDDPSRGHKVLLLTDGEHNHKRGLTRYHAASAIDDPLFFALGQDNLGQTVDGELCPPRRPGEPAAPQAQPYLSASCSGKPFPKGTLGVSSVSLGPDVKDEAKRVLAQIAEATSGDPRFFDVSNQATAKANLEKVYVHMLTGMTGGVNAESFDNDLGPNQSRRHGGLAPLSTSRVGNIVPQLGRNLLPLSRQSEVMDA